MGGSEKMDVQLAPLMSKLQREFLDKMLQGVIGGVSDFPLGAGFPGYGPDMYSPRPFEYGKRAFSGREGWVPREDKDKDNDENGNGNGDDGNGPIPKARPPFQPVGAGLPPGGFTPGMMTPGIPAMGGLPPGGQTSPMPPGPSPGLPTPPGPTPLNWFSMLNQQAPPQDPRAMIPQMLTTPFMDPFRYGLTGNYPRRT